jgi:hypothetical protein
MSAPRPIPNLEDQGISGDGITIEFAGSRKFLHPAKNAFDKVEVPSRSTNINYNCA